MDRRQFLAAAGLGGAATLSIGYASGAAAQTAAALPGRTSSWDAVKSQFDIKPGIVQMSAFYLASHPAPVRAAIERHRRGLDQEAHGYIEENVGELERAVRAE